MKSYLSDSYAGAFPLGACLPVLVPVCLSAWHTGSCTVEVSCSHLLEEVVIFPLSSFCNMYILCFLPFDNYKKILDARVIKGPPEGNLFVYWRLYLKDLPDSCHLSLPLSFSLSFGGPGWPQMLHTQGWP